MGVTHHSPAKAAHGDPALGAALAKQEGLSAGKQTAIIWQSIDCITESGVLRTTDLDRE